MPTLLHVGCGRKDKTKTTKVFSTPEWQEIRLDIDPQSKPDVVASMLEMSSVANQSVDAIYTFTGPSPSSLRLRVVGEVYL